MPDVPDRAYTSDHRQCGEGILAFACSQDRTIWPWLDLPPHHPVPIQTQNYWISVECSAVLGGFDRDKWSALVWTDWTIEEPNVGQAVRGTFANHAEGKDRGFTTTLYDAENRRVVRMRGRGVVFRTRDFESWRARSKTEASIAGYQGRFAYVDRRRLGLVEGEMPLVGSLDGDRATALVTRENGFMPGNRFIGGSGDHVNSTHIAEVARQVMLQLPGCERARLTGGDMALNRYIELGTPFAISVIEQGDGHVRLAVSQLGRPCSKITLRFERR